MLARRSLLTGLRCWAALDAPLTRVGAWGCFDAIGLGSKAFGGQEGAAKPKGRASSETRGSAPAKPKVAVGDVHEREARFSYAQVREFALLTGDTNPIHSAPTGTEAEARGTCIVPGILCASLFPTIIGSTFPGSLYLDQSLAFKTKVYVGDEVTARLVVTHVEGRKTHFATQCFKRSGHQGASTESASANASSSAMADGDGGDRVLVIEGEARALIR
mmetsp:Transcript_17653/g.36137  ORF Transcript_17653/g.36137 Transcript_17653/m.36137 type:complete len:218 (+) Transcript_17653:137-790(+)